MEKLKIGDKVKVIGSSGWNRYKGHIGRTGIITTIKVSPQQEFPDLYILDFMANEAPSNVYRITGDELEKIT